MFNEYFEYISDVHDCDTLHYMYLYMAYEKTNVGQSCIN